MRCVSLTFVAVHDQLEHSLPRGPGKEEALVNRFAPQVPNIS